MLKKWRYISTLFAINSGLLFADPCCDAPATFEVFGEFLYLMPTVDDTYFAIVSPVTSAGNPNGTRVNNNFDFYPGFRVGAVVSPCSNDKEWQTVFTRLRATQNRTVNGSFLWATLGRADFASAYENYTGSATSNLDSLYEALEVRFAQNLWNCRGFDVQIRVGVEAAYLRFQENYTYSITDGITGTIHDTSRTWGVGPQFGLALNYELFNWGCNNHFGFFAAGAGSLLTGETKTNETNISNAVSLLNTTDQDAWRIIPALHAKFGVNYDFSLCNLDASIGLGYEFNSYIRGSSRVIYPDDIADSLSSNQYFNFDNQGLYVSATVLF